MSENERLREALRDMIELSMEDDSMWELHETSFQARRRAASNALASKPEVFADRLNALERDNSTLNAELTETIAAVSDLMDENAALKERLDKMRHVIELLKSGAEEALKINPHHDTLCYKQEEPMGSGECDCWRSYCHATIETANKYLADSLRKEETGE